jgi:hypothetical protein
MPCFNLGAYGTLGVNFINTLMLMKLTTGLNFINIFFAHVLCQYFGAKKLQGQHFSFEIFGAKNLYKKRASKTWMKLTVGFADRNIDKLPPSPLKFNSAVVIPIDVVIAIFCCEFFTILISQRIATISRKTRHTQCVECLKQNV